MKTLVYSIISFLCLGHLGAQAQNNDWVFAYASDQFPLYLGVENPIIFSSKKAPKKLKKLEFSVDNGKVSPVEGSNQLILQPERIGALKLTVRDKKGAILTEQDYQVLDIPIPKPTMVTEAGEAISTDNPIPQGVTIRVAALTDPVFTLLNPNATYQVSQLELRQFRGGRAIANKKQNSATINLEELETAPGDGFQIKVTEVLHKDSQGKTQTVAVKSPYVSFFVK